MAAEQQRPKRPPIKFNGAYFCSWNFIMKLLEIIFLIVTIVLASQFTGPESIVYIQIICALGAATCIAWVVLFIINLNARFPEFFPMLMMGYHFAMALLVIGVVICCGILWPQFKTSVYPHYCVSTICSFLAAVLFIIDAMLNVLWWRGAVDEVATTPCSPWSYEVTL